MTYQLSFASKKFLMKSGKNDIRGLHFTSLADFRCTRLIANCLTFFLHSSMIVLGSKTCANNAKVTCYFHKFSFLSNQDNMQIQKRENNDNDYIHRRIKKLFFRTCWSKVVYFCHTEETVKNDGQVPFWVTSEWCYLIKQI